jgi:hypothetical protein
MARIRSIIESIATIELSLRSMLPPCLGLEVVHQKRDFVSKQVTKQPTLMFDSDTRQPGSGCVCVQNLDPDRIAALSRRAQADQLLQSILRVKVVGAGVPGVEDIPDVFGRYQLMQGGIRFLPYFPFETGVLYRARFDPRPLACPELSEVATLEFSLPGETSAAPTQVTHVFPSSD